jgi:elongation factor G
MMCGSAFKNKGVQAVLDAVCAFMPSPVDVEAITGVNPDTEEEEKRKPRCRRAFAALGFQDCY